LDDVLARGTYTIHTNNDLGPSEDVCGLERDVDRIVPNERLLLSRGKGLARDLCDAMLESKRYCPVDTIVEGVLAVDVIRTGYLAMGEEGGVGVARHEDRCEYSEEPHSYCGSVPWPGLGAGFSRRLSSSSSERNFGKDLRAI